MAASNAPDFINRHYHPTLLRTTVWARIVHEKYFAIATQGGGVSNFANAHSVANECKFDFWGSALSYVAECDFESPLNGGSNLRLLTLGRCRHFWYLGHSMSTTYFQVRIYQDSKSVFIQEPNANLKFANPTSPASSVAKYWRATGKSDMVLSRPRT